MLLEHIGRFGVAVPGAGGGSARLSLSSDEISLAAGKLKHCGADDGAVLIGMGIGSKMPVKIWPKERYLQVLQRLGSEIFPVLLGGDAEFVINSWLIERFGRGANFAGKANPREALALLRHCQLYLGNDTGTMHLAVAAGIRCVGVFSARDVPGKWHPYGEGHFVHRKRLPCEGCMLEQCIDYRMKCLLDIEVVEVVRSCQIVLTSAKERSVEARRGPVAST
jgi:ADP-heptose:LPS heptosyltransferase